MSKWASVHGLGAIDVGHTLQAAARTAALCALHTSLTFAVGPEWGPYLGQEFTWQSLLYFVFSFTYHLIVVLIFGAILAGL